MPADPTPLPKQHVTVDGIPMAYHVTGEGRPIVLLHGNPTSSYLWRGVIPHLEGLGRVIAPDLVGMGDSGKLADSGPDRYTLVDHRRYLDGVLDHLGVDGDVVMVVHDWGGGLGLDWANRHREATSGVAYTETILGALEGWNGWPEASRSLFQAMRSDAGEEIILEKNVFVERILPASVLEPLPDEVMAEYRRPYTEPGESRRPTLTWPRQIPIEGQPADVVDIVESYRSWLAESEVPKLFIAAEPGFLTPVMRTFCDDWPNQTEVTVPGIHFVQEDSPDEIGRALADWIRSI